MSFFYFGKSRVFLPKLLGAFILFLAIVMFIVSSGQMFDSWDAMGKYPACVPQIGTQTDSVAMLQYLDCKESLYNITGLQLRPDQPRITERQFVITLLSPVAGLLFWAAAFVFGLFLYKTRIVKPDFAKPDLEKIAARHFRKKRKK